MYSGRKMVKFNNKLAIPCIVLFATMSLVTALAMAEEPGVARFDLVIRDRHLVNEEKTLRVKQGASVELVWDSDEDVDLHLHGYDIEFHVDAGVPFSQSFLARATGRFPITSHGFADEAGHGHAAIAYLEVHPD
jgi:hypothetical protein